MVWRSSEIARHQTEPALSRFQDSLLAEIRFFLLDHDIHKISVWAVSCTGATATIGEKVKVQKTFSLIETKRAILHQLPKSCQFSQFN
jgi:hypothetical protein